jgi:protein-S-isoprenylcysteine O-methyltransferase Ste14
VITLQILFVFLFASNLLLLWISRFAARWSWYRFWAELLMLLLPLITVFFKQPRFELDYFWWEIGGGAAILAGIAIIGWASLEMARKGVDGLALSPAALVASGPYHYVRHPQYLGLIFMVVGWWWLFAAAYSFYFGMFMLLLIWIQGYLEEKLILEEKFGQEYRDYRLRTGMFWVK